MESSVKIRNRLKELRLSKNFRRQEDLAEALGVEQNTISAIENDVNFVSRDMLADLCEKLGCDVGELFFADRA